MAESVGAMEKKERDLESPFLFLRSDEENLQNYLNCNSSSE
jgi:hypothetical protein